MKTDYSESDPQYHQNEMTRAQRDADRIRKESVKPAEILDYLRDAVLVAERIDWLLNGTFGYAQQWQAWQIVNAKRGNKEAALVQQLMLWDAQCKEDNTRKAWHMLTADEQTALNTAVQSGITSAQDGEC